MSHSAAMGRRLEPESAHDHTRFETGGDWHAARLRVAQTKGPIVVQHTRLDSRKASNALITTIAYSDPDPT